MLILVLKSTNNLLIQRNLRIQVHQIYSLKILKYFVNT